MSSKSKKATKKVHPAQKQALRLMLLLKRAAKKYGPENSQGCAFMISPRPPHESICLQSTERTRIMSVSAMIKTDQRVVPGSRQRQCCYRLHQLRLQDRVDGLLITGKDPPIAEATSITGRGDAGRSRATNSAPRRGVRIWQARRHWTGPPTKRAGDHGPQAVVAIKISERSYRGRSASMTDRSIRPVTLRPRSR